MTTFFTKPKGALISFGGFNFKPKRSKQLPSEYYAVPDASMAVLGDFDMADQAGYATQSSTGLYVWQYDVYCSQASGDTPKDVQDELTALETALRTQNSDGTTGQVALLTVALLGYDPGTTTASGIARLISSNSTASFSTREVLQLTFRVPQGFSYTI